MMIDDNLFYPSPILSKFFQIPLQVRRHYFFGAMQWPLTCSIPSHAPWAPPGEMLSDLMRCNFTNKVSDDLLRTLPHGPVYPTLQYWTGTILQYSISIISKLFCLNLKNTPCIMFMVFSKPERSPSIRQNTSSNWFC